MRMAHSRGRIFLGLLLVGTFMRSRIPDAAMTTGLKNIVSVGVSNDHAEPDRGSVIFANQQPGNDLGAQIVAANAALGSAKGEIRVARSGTISEPISLLSNHDLVCAGQVTLMLSTPTASISQHSNTRIQGCTLASNQILPPSEGAEILSHGTSHVQVDQVTFIGGGYHIKYDTVSNFSIKDTRHVSITATGGSPILIDSSTQGQIISAKIDGYVVPAGNLGIRLIGVNKSTFIAIRDPTIRDVDASTVPGCGGVTFTASHNSILRGGVIHGLKNCDGVLTESTGIAASSDIDIIGTVSADHNASPGLGKNANNGEGFDIFNSQRVRLSEVRANNNGETSGNHQPGIEVSNSREISIKSCIANDNGADGIKIDGSPGVSLAKSHTNHNGGAGILVMPALGRVSVTSGSPIVDWTPGGANITFSAVWPAGTKIVIGGAVYTVASFQSTTRLTLTNDLSAATAEYAYNVDSYVEIRGGESLDNGQRSAALPVTQNGGQREGVYFAGGFSGDITGRVTSLHAADTQRHKTQTFGIRIENHARIVAKDNAVSGNLAGGIKDSPGKSSIH